MNELRIELSYKEKGFIAPKKVNETKWLLFEFLNKTNDVNYYVNDFSSAFKKAMKVFSSSKVYDVELRIESDATAYFLVTQSSDDLSAGVYTVYDYCTKNATNILKMSKSAIIDRFQNIINEVVIYPLG